MSPRSPRHDELLMQLPLPLAQLYRRAQNATRAEDRHLHAYYLAEAALKLAASLRIGIVLADDRLAGSPLARRLEKLCMPMVGEWVGFLRETALWLRQLPDVSLLPLAEEHDTLLRPGTFPAVRAFAQAVSAGEPGEHQPLHPTFVRDALKQGILGFFTILANYRNKIIGHGAPKLPAYYQRVGPLLMDAICETLQQRCLFGNLTLAVCRLNTDADGRLVEYEWRRLVNLGSLLMPREDVLIAATANGPPPSVVPGHVYFVGEGVQVSLHPLAVYLEDRTERERVAFLNDTVIGRHRDGQGETADEVRRCEYLDYATGDHVRDLNVNGELTRLLARLRGQPVSPSEIERLATASQPVPDDPTVTEVAAVHCGDFEVLDELGRGAMGIVYRARQRSLNRTVALKVLPPSLAADPVLLARFWREIAALARCEHPNLVKIITSGSDGDRHYYAMELVEGADLAAVFHVLRDWRQNGQHGGASLFDAVGHAHDLRQHGSDADGRAGNSPTPASPPEIEEEGPRIRIDSTSDGASPARQASRSAGSQGTLSAPSESRHDDRWAKLFASAADGLAHLHARGILHRDLKPGNLMLTSDSQRLVIMDLGLAQVQDRTQALTQVTTRWLGTLRYCAPEQLRWNLLDIDERADIYGFGAALYEMVTLKPLFDGDSEARLIEQILHEEPVEPRTLDPAIPRDLNAIIMHCLEKDRSQRYASAELLADDLRRYGEGQPVSVRQLTGPQRLGRWCRNNRWIATLLAMVASLLIIVSVGATSAAIVLANLLTQTRNAEAKAQQESLRALAEQLGRQELEESENAADFALVREQIRADRFEEANQTLASAWRRVERSPTLARRRDAWHRVGQVVAFYRANDRAWNLWGEEDYTGVIAAAQAALPTPGRKGEPPWWKRLPTTDLDASEQERFQQEVYRLLMLKSGVYTVAASILAEHGGESPPADQMVPLVESATSLLRQAAAWEVERHGSPSVASHVMERVNQRLLKIAGVGDAEPNVPDRQVILSDTDYYFLGLMFFVIERNPASGKTACPLDRVIHAGSMTPAATRDEGARGGLLGRLLQEELTRFPLPRGAHHLETSERLLRVAAGRELRYWPSFALGRTLFFAGKYSEAELAFGTCASLRPDYARSYEQRALMLALQAISSEDAHQRAKLEELAWEDSRHALALAERARDPSTWWPQGDLLLLLGRPVQALHAYRQAIERDDSIRQKINRRNNLACVRNLAQQQIEDPDTSPDVRADALAVLALAILAQDDSPESIEQARHAADKSLRLSDDQPHAWAARGQLSLLEAQALSPTADTRAARQAWEQALSSFERARQGAPENYQAASGRATALEKLGRSHEALAAWSQLIDVRSASPADFGESIALTDLQRANAQLGRARALEQLGREAEAQQARSAASQLAPGARE